MKRFTAFISMMLLAGCGVSPSTASSKPSDLRDLRTVAANAIAPSLAKIGNQFFLAYQSTKSGDQSVYLSTSQDASSWSAPAKISAGEVPCLFDLNGKPAVAFASGNEGISISCDGAIASAIPGWATHPSVIPLRQGGYAMAYNVLGGGCEVVKSQDGVHYGAPVAVCPDGYEPSIAQKADGLVVAYTNQDGIAEVSEQNGQWSEPQQVVSDPTALGPNLSVTDRGLALAFSRANGKARDLVQVVDGQEAALYSNGSRCAHPSVLLQNGELLVALGIKNSDGGQGVYLLAKPSSR